MTYRIKLADGYVEYEFNLTGTGNYSIQDLLNAILKECPELTSDKGKISERMWKQREEHERKEREGN